MQTVNASTYKVTLCVESFYLQDSPEYHQITSPRVDDEVGAGVDRQKEVAEVRQVVKNGTAGIWTTPDLVLGVEPIAAPEYLVQVREDLHGLAEDEKDGDGDEDDAQVSLTFLAGRHLRVQIAVRVAHVLKEKSDDGISCNIVIKRVINQDSGLAQTGR